MYIINPHPSLLSFSVVKMRYTARFTNTGPRRYPLWSSSHRGEFRLHQGQKAGNDVTPMAGIRARNTRTCDGRNRVSTARVYNALHVSRYIPAHTYTDSRPNVLGVAIKPSRPERPAGSACLPIFTASPSALSRPTGSGIPVVLFYPRTDPHVQVTPLSLDTPTSFASLVRGNRRGSCAGYFPD